MDNYMVYFGGDEEHSEVNLTLQQAKDIAMARASWLVEHGDEEDVKEIFIAKVSHTLFLKEFKEENFYGDGGTFFEPNILELT